MMLYQERAERVLQRLKLQSTVKVGELSQLLGVSVDTVRRDLKAMEQEGLVRCVRGGACLPEAMLSFSGFTGREIIHSDWKRESARKAIAYIREGDVVALNSGTTNTVLAQELSGLNKRITVVTNNLAAGNLLMPNASIRLFLVGGQVDAAERSTYGAACEAEFAMYHPDIAFLSINAVNYRDGFTDFRFNEMGIIKLLAGTAKKVIAVMDSSKLGQCSKKNVLAPEQVDLLVMDDHVPDEVRKEYLEKGIQIL